MGGIGLIKIRLRKLGRKTDATRGSTSLLCRPSPYRTQHLRHESERAFMKTNVLVLVAVISCTTLIVQPLFASGSIAARHTFSLEERMTCQEAIEKVYYQHRIWPRENSELKPTFEAAVPEAVIARKVEDALAMSETLAKRFRTPITSADLQSELNRMAHESRDTKMLGELFAALDNDAERLAECLARPALAQSRLRAAYREVASPHQLFDRWWEKARQEESNSLTEFSPPRVDYRLPLIGKDSACTDDTWSQLSQAPLAPHVPEAIGPGRIDASAVWTGSEMIIWGGGTTCQDSGSNNIDACQPNVGNLYYPATNSWAQISTLFAPDGRIGPVSVWTGAKMIVWGGFPDTNTGGVYDPAANAWSLISTGNAPSARSNMTSVWTGSEMIVWGGISLGMYLNTGGRYNPATNQWTATNPAAPSPRAYHTAVWTGTKMIVWGGTQGNETALNSGGVYDPQGGPLGSWSATVNSAGTPIPRYAHTAVWTGDKMIIWGGVPADDVSHGLNTGGLYDPSTGSWTATSTEAVPEQRGTHIAVWTGSEMIVWGGSDGGTLLNSGGRFNPTTGQGGTWSATRLAPLGPRERGTVVWTGHNMIIWSGTGNQMNPEGLFSDGAAYCAATEPQIFFNDMPMPINGTSPQAVVAGQQINLRIVPSNLVGLWTVPGNRVGGYDVTPNCPYPNCSATFTESPDLTKPTAKFYWLTNGTYQVRYDYIGSNNNVASVKATFSVSGPLDPTGLVAPSAFAACVANPRSPYPSCTPVPGLSQFFPPNTSISCGTDTNPCIFFKAAVTVRPPVPSSAKLQFVQKIISNTNNVNALDDNKYSCKTIEDSLDTFYPYPTLAIGNIGLTTSATAADSPRWALAFPGIRLKEEKVDFHAQMFILWNSGLDNAIPVPIGSINWSWKANAKLENGSWEIDGPKNSMTPFSTILSDPSRPAYPLWQIKSNGNFTCMRQR